MTMPTVTAPRLLIFAEAARQLQISGQALVKAGQLENLVLESMEVAIAQAEAQLQAQDLPRSPSLRQMVQSVLKLTQPDVLLAFVQELVNVGDGPNFEQFLATTGAETEGLLIPVGVLYAAVLQQLLAVSEQLPAAEKTTLEQELQTIEEALTTACQPEQVDLGPVRTLVQDQLAELSEPDLLNLLQEILTVSNAASEPGQTVFAGPLVFVTVADYLLAEHAADLTPDQQLDLRLNREKAQAKLGVMERLGKLEPDEKAQQLQEIQSMIQSRPAPDLWLMLEDWFGAESDE